MELNSILNSEVIAAGKVIAVCISEKKGTQKQMVPDAEVITDWGIKGDAHAGKWHRQVSLLSYEQIQAFRERGAEVNYGAFGENLVISGFDFKTIPVGTIFRIGDVLLELTQIGKECHSHCEIFKKMGDCIMPREGVFTQVLHGGHIEPGDEVFQFALAPDRLKTAAVIEITDELLSIDDLPKQNFHFNEFLSDHQINLVETIQLSPKISLIQMQINRLISQRQIDYLFILNKSIHSQQDCEKMILQIQHQEVSANNLDKVLISDFHSEYLMSAEQIFQSGKCKIFHLTEVFP